MIPKNWRYSRGDIYCLIRRIEVYRGYKLHVDFNIDFAQFDLGLDMIEVAA